MESNRIYFISGHLDLEDHEWDKHYKPVIDEAVKDPNSRFVVGDARGTDVRAQKYLSTLDPKPHLTIYHMFNKPRNNKGSWPTRGGFENDGERDEAMTRDSTDDIAWVRSPEEMEKRLGDKYDPKRLNGTMKNILRRQKN